MGGDVYFDDCYEGNPLVNALCAGILRHEEIQKGAATGVGNPVYYVGQHNIPDYQLQWLPLFEFPHAVKCQHTKH